MIRILVATNRNPLKDGNDREISFGESFNQDPLAGPVELRFAWATYQDDAPASEDSDAKTARLKGLKDQEIVKKKDKALEPNQQGFASIPYTLEIIPDVDKNSDDKPPSVALFNNILKQIKADKSGSSDQWLLFVHGYNNQFHESIESAMRLAYRYKTVRQSQQNINTTINIILFSWPSHPGGLISNPINAYKRTQRAAIQSAQAFSRLLDRLESLLIIPARKDRSLANALRDVKLSLVCHSLGNLVLQSYVSMPPQGMHNDLFRRVILHQADVDEANHAAWINQMSITKDTWITLNEFDVVLRFLSNFANGLNPINPPRLGQGTTNPAAKAIYVNCTKAKSVTTDHNLFLASNPRLQTLCSSLMDGSIDPLGSLGLNQDTAHPNVWRFPSSD